MQIDFEIASIMALVPTMGSVSATVSVLGIGGLTKNAEVCKMSQLEVFSLGRQFKELTAPSSATE